MKTATNNAFELGRIEGLKYGFVSKRERITILTDAGLADSLGEATAAFKRGLAAGQAESKATRIAATKADLGDGPYWTVNAEHTAGQGTGHPCSCGMVDDPVDVLDVLVAAPTAEEAERLAWIELERAVAEFTPCRCGKQSQVGSEQWYSSVSLTAREVAESELA